MKLTDYIPINCNSYDILLDKATLKKRCEILYSTQEGNRLQKEAIIVDVFTKNKEEFLVLNDGIIIRLDKIITIDNEQINKGNGI